jgi:hypothetical protein
LLAYYKGSFLSAIPNTHMYDLGLIRPDNAWNGIQPPISACKHGDHLENVGFDGCVGVPDDPGPGVTYDRDKINRCDTENQMFE